MLEAIQSIPGPSYLLYFWILTVALVIVAGITARDDGTDGPIPWRKSFPPTYVAALIGGTTNIIQTAVYSLVTKGLARIEGEGKGVRVRAIPSRDLPQDELEEVVYRHLTMEQGPDTLFLDKQLNEALKERLPTTIKKLEAAKLARSEKEAGRVATIWLLGWFVVGVVAGVKLYYGFTLGKPIGYLSLSLVIALFAVIGAVRPFKTTTRLGDRYVAHLKTMYGWHKEAVKKNKMIEGVNLGYVIALFGIGVLQTGPVADLLLLSQKAMEKDASSSSGCGGCGGGGSSGCGGGCGGCGGCG